MRITPRHSKARSGSSARRCCSCWRACLCRLNCFSSRCLAAHSCITGTRRVTKCPQQARRQCQTRWSRCSAACSRSRGSSRSASVSVGYFALRSKVCHSYEARVFCIAAAQRLSFAQSGCAITLTCKR